MPDKFDTRQDLRLQEYAPREPSDSPAEPVRWLFGAGLLQQATHRQPAGIRNAKPYRH